MTFKTVSYSRLRSFGNFENERVGVELEVSDGESAEDVLTAAIAWVEKRLSERITERLCEQESRVLDGLRRDVVEETGRLQKLYDKIDEARSKLREAGIDFEPEMPF